MKVVSEGIEEVVDAVDSGQGGITPCYRFCTGGSAGVGRSYRLSAGGSEWFHQNISVGEPERQRPVLEGPAFQCFGQHPLGGVHLAAYLAVGILVVILADAESVVLEVGADRFGLVQQPSRSVTMGESLLR